MNQRYSALARRGVLQHAPRRALLGCASSSEGRALPPGPRTRLKFIQFLRFCTFSLSTRRSARCIRFSPTFKPSARNAAATCDAHQAAAARLSSGRSGRRLRVVRFPRARACRYVPILWPNRRRRLKNATHERVELILRQTGVRRDPVLLLELLYALDGDAWGGSRSAPRQRLARLAPQARRTEPLRYGGCCESITRHLAQHIDARLACGHQARQRTARAVESLRG